MVLKPTRPNNKIKPISELVLTSILVFVYNSELQYLKWAALSMLNQKLYCVRYRNNLHNLSCTDEYLFEISVLEHSASPVLTDPWRQEKHGLARQAAEAIYGIYPWRFSVCLISKKWFQEQTNAMALPERLVLKGGLCREAILHDMKGIINIVTVGSEESVFIIYFVTVQVTDWPAEIW